MNNKAITKLMNNAKDGTAFPVIDLIRSPADAALFSKTIKGVNQIESYDSKGNRKINQPDVGQVKAIASNTASAISDNRTIRQILPDIGYAGKILTAGVLSPKDMTTVELTYNAPVMSVPSDVSASLLAVAKEHYDTRYKIVDMLPKILDRALFETGSYPIAIIPENSLDAIINGANFDNRAFATECAKILFDTDNKKEQKIVHFGTIGNPVDPKTAGMESGNVFRFNTTEAYEPRIMYDENVDTMIRITDNHNLLRMPFQNNVIQEKKRREILRTTSGLESAITDAAISSALFKQRAASHEPTVMLSTGEDLVRGAIGEPLHLILPSESVVNVFVPGRPDEHVAHLMLIDMDGHPISLASDTNYLNEMQSRLNNASSNNGNNASALLERVRRDMSGSNLTGMALQNTMINTYASIVERNIISRFKSGGIYSSNVEIARNEDAFTIMFARALQGKGTQLVVIPPELMTYFAFDYTDRGIGKSMLEDIKVISSLRIVLKFINVQAAIKNAIGRTEVKVKFDPDDPDPRSTMEKVYHEILSTRGNSFPAGLITPAAIADWLAGAGMEFTYSDHPALPDVAIDFGEKASNHVQPSTDLDDAFRRETAMHLGVPPEIVDNTFQSEFATSVITNNLLLAKNVMQIQAVLERHVANFLSRTAKNSETLVKKLVKIVDENYDKILDRLIKDDVIQGDMATTSAKLSRKSVISYVVETFIDGITVSLPRPNSATAKNQKEALDTYVELLDAAIENYLSSEIVNSDMSGDVAQYVDNIKKIIRSYYIRKFMAENGIMPELADLIATNEEGLPLVDFYHENADHINNLTKTLGDFMKRVNDVKEASDAANGERTGEEAGSYDSPDGGGSDDSGGDGGDGGDGGFDFGNDSDLNPDESGGNPDENPDGEDETPPEDSPEDKPEEEKPTEDEPKE